MANKKKQFDQEFKQNAVNYCAAYVINRRGMGFVD